MSSAPSFADLLDLTDSSDQALINQVHPQYWVNPTPADRYDLVVIGAGPAGLVVAAGAAGLGLGLKIALVEKQLMGGDCLNFGCVPSKALIRSARVIGELRRATATSLGIQVDPDAIAVDFAAVMSRLRAVRAGLSIHDSAQRFQSLGIDVFLGQAQFCDRRSVQVGEATLHFRKAVIATGSRPRQPDIEGLNSVDFLTNETVFTLTDCPHQLAIIGGGPIGCELAQAFQRLGSQVTLIQKHSQLLCKEDLVVAELIQKQLQQEGVQVLLDTQIDRIENKEVNKILSVRSQAQYSSIEADAILVAAGRSPNVEMLNLAVAGVDYDLVNGVQVNDYLQTTNPNIYAAGDICSNQKLTHAADTAARLVIKNALFSPFGLGRAKISDCVIPRVTFTDPEVAHVGLTETLVKQQDIAIATITIPLNQVDRAIIDGETEGFIRIHHQPNSDRILGATIVASHAGEMISEVTAAIANRLGLNALSGVIHPYPTQAEGIKKAADAYRRTRLTPLARQILQILQKLS